MIQFVVAKTKNARDGKSFQVLSWNNFDLVYTVHFKVFDSYSGATERADALNKAHEKMLSWEM